MRWSLIVISVVAAAVAGGAGALVLHAHRFPATPLFAGVAAARSFEAGQRLLKARIGARYAVGRPEGDLAGYLRAQGMQVRRTAGGAADAPAAAGLARALQGPGVCDRVVVVSWYADRAGVLTDLKVVYGDTGCL